MKQELDVEIVVTVRQHREAGSVRHVAMRAEVRLDGDDPDMNMMSAEALVRALEEAGQAARKIVGSLPYRTDVKIINGPRPIVVPHDYGTD